jgi:hypothetical protein
MLRGSSPIQLSQLDISPAIQAGALEQQAASGIRRRGIRCYCKGPTDIEVNV